MYILHPKCSNFVKSESHASLLCIQITIDVILHVLVFNAKHLREMAKLCLWEWDLFLK